MGLLLKVNGAQKHNQRMKPVAGQGAELIIPPICGSSFPLNKNGATSKGAHPATAFARGPA